MKKKEKTSDEIKLSTLKNQVSELRLKLKRRKELARLRKVLSGEKGSRMIYPVGVRYYDSPTRLCIDLKKTEAIQLVEWLGTILP